MAGVQDSGRLPRYGRPWEQDGEDDAIGMRGTE
jgi:hypothetical protein